MDFQSAEINEIAAALSAAQGEFEPADKAAVNPHFGKKYADLSAVWEVVRGVLPKHGLSVVQTMRATDDGRAAVHTMLMHKSGQWLAGICALPVPKADPQGFGSAYTYARRYSLSAILGIVSEEDDDGEGAKGKPEGKKEKRSTPPGPRRPDFEPYDTDQIKAKMEVLPTLATLGSYLKSLAVPDGHPQKPDIAALYKARKAQIEAMGEDGPPADTPGMDPTAADFLAHDGTQEAAHA